MDIPTSPPQSQESSVLHRSPYRVLLRVSVAFVALFLLIRALAIEPFGVPTGSMAPALIGNHREGPCPRCGFPVRVGLPGGGDVGEHFAHVGCPNCGQSFTLADSPDLSGDRVLVDKNVYNLRHPRRWEMAVFHCPDPDPKEFGKPYVKRVVGLPGETITIIGGDAFANHELLRKDLRELRETRDIVLDMQHVPKPEGWQAHWEAKQSSLNEGTLTLNGLNREAHLTYRHWNLDSHREEPIKSWSSYDGLPRSFSLQPPAHDFSLDCEIEVVEAAEGATFACRLFDGADAVNTEITVGQRSEGRAVLNHDDRGPLHTTNRAALRPGHRHRLEFAFVDRRAIFALDGVTILTADLPPVAGRGEVSRPLQLGARKCKLVVRNLKLYRDTYYTQYGENGTRTPITLGPDEYFMLGDNSGNSQDSRKWPRPGVPEGDFVGKPFLVHQPLRTARVTVGGRDRAFQTVDWSRLRWLH